MNDFDSLRSMAVKQFEIDSAELKRVLEESFSECEMFLKEDGLSPGNLQAFKRLDDASDAVFELWFSWQEASHFLTVYMDQHEELRNGWQKIVEQKSTSRAPLPKPSGLALIRENLKQFMRLTLSKARSSRPMIYGKTLLIRGARASSADRTRDGTASRHSTVLAKVS